MFERIVESNDTIVHLVASISEVCALMTRSITGLPYLHLADLEIAGVGGRLDEVAFAVDVEQAAAARRGSGRRR